MPYVFEGVNRWRFYIEKGLIPFVEISPQFT